MAKGVMVVWSRPESPDKEAEFNNWYDTVHIPELTSTGACSRVTRHKLAADQLPGTATPGHNYMAVYEFDDLQAGMAEFARIKTTPGPIGDPMVYLLDGIHEYVR